MSLVTNLVGMATTEEQLKQIRDEVWDLKQSPLYTYRTENKYYPVLGEGGHTARVVFVGEAPGENEAKTGRPFAGAAGKVLDQLLASINLKREDVYIANLVKDRPPGNRDPQPEEIELYGPFLIRQLEAIQPKVVATLGRHSLQYLLQYFGAPEFGQTITKLHGRVIPVKASYGPLTLVPLYHPAAALYNPNLRAVQLEDIKVLSGILKG